MEKTFDGKQLVQEGDIICIFNFKTKEYEEHELYSGKTQRVIATKTGVVYTSHYNMATSENITYDEAVANSTIEWVLSNHLWFYKKGESTFLAAMNSNVFTAPTLLAGKGRISVLKRDAKHAELKQIVDWFVEGKLGIDSVGTLVEYKKGKNKKYNILNLI